MCSSPSLYIHIPFCVSKCDYCDFFSVAQGMRPVDDSYVSAVLREEKFFRKKLDVDFWSTVYIGGGTPSLLSCGQLEKLLRGVKAFSSKEVTVEVNPESLTESFIKTFLNNGGTRISMGVQSLNEASLSLVHRHCSLQKTKEALELVRSFKNNSFSLNLDVIAGLPGLTDEAFVKSLKEIISYFPEHISMYTLTLEENTPLYKRIEEGEKWSEENADSQWLLGRDILFSLGYRQYEVSNFSKNGFESIHNFSYWKQEDYVGLGCAACGSLYGKEGVRFENTHNISEYIDFWTNFNLEAMEENAVSFIKKSGVFTTESLSPETEEFEFLMMGLRTLRGCSQNEYKRRYSSVLPWKGSLKTRLGLEAGLWKDYLEKGWARVEEIKDDIYYSLSEEGILFLNKVLQNLLT